MLKAGIIGLGRGAAHMQVFKENPNVEVVAVCDIVRERAEGFARENNVPKAFDNYKDMLKLDLDMVSVCTPLPYHAEHSIAAMKSGKHVISEVPAVYNLEECEQVVQTVEDTGLKYMLAENCCYSELSLGWKKLVDKGRLGKIIYAEAEYVHDCRGIMKNENGLTWRASLPPIHYCTHSLGPLLFAMDDYCVSAVGFHTGCNVAPVLGAIDMEVGLFRTAKGATIKILCGFSVVRKPAFHWYVMYGTKGSVETMRNSGNNAEKYLIDEQPDKMTEYLLDSAGHGTAEYRMIDEFVKSIINDTTPPIDVYKAMDYTAPGICAHISAESNGTLVEIPNYQKKN